MKNLIIPKDYHSLLSVYDTQVAIKYIKDAFQERLIKALDVMRVSAPLIVDPKSGLNDNLCGYEKAVSFECIESKTKIEIFQSLAKWKRYALKKYGLKGLYTDMNAIRPYEDLDNIHSLYVDQWDWEKVIDRSERNEEYLKKVVNKIYQAIRETEELVYSKYDFSSLAPQSSKLPKELYFISSEELLEMYQGLDSKEREYEIVKRHKAVFITHIGDSLKDGKPHDLRAADYDDWSLNGDLLFYDEVLDIAFEITSMGIRVDSDSLKYQLDKKNENYKLEMGFHQDVISDNLPLTIGGGIGQSRLCMYLLKKAHIGEVQVSYWPSSDIELFKKAGIYLL